MFKFEYHVSTVHSDTTKRTVYFVQFARPENQLPKENGTFVQLNLPSALTLEELSELQGSLDTLKRALEQGEKRNDASQ